MSLGTPVRAAFRALANSGVSLAASSAIDLAPVSTAIKTTQNCGYDIYGYYYCDPPDDHGKEATLTAGIVLGSIGLVTAIVSLVFYLTDDPIKTTEDGAKVTWRGMDIGPLQGGGLMATGIDF